VVLAREVGASMGTFGLVVTSEVPRTLETAIAMGFAVDDHIVMPPDIASAAMDVTGHHDRWTWEAPWVQFTEMVDQEGPVATLGDWLRAAWRAVLEAIPDDGRVLAISHGRVIEVGVIACLPNLPRTAFSLWGEPLHPCEGVRLTYSDGLFLDAQILRTRRCAPDHSDDWQRA
jgi:broad specificity phosphatase PhoE